MEISVLTGLTTAAILFLVSVGLSLIFGTLRIINMAHGTLYMVGAYILTVYFAGESTHLLGFLGGLITAAVFVAVIGILIEVFVMRRLYGSDDLFQLLATWAIMLILDELSLIAWGSNNMSGPMPTALSGPISIAGQYFPAYDVFLVGAAVIIAVLLWVLLRFTRLGRLIRAAVQDTELIYTLGVNVRRLYAEIFALGAFLAALGGALIAPMTSIGPGMDSQIIVEAFIVCVIGGLGSIWGTVVGALIIGLVQSLGNLYVPNLASLAPYLVMVIILVTRPQGIFGKVEG